jgi:hypothetical protein
MWREPIESNATYGSGASPTGGLSDAWPKPIPIITCLYSDPPGEAITDPAVVTQWKRDGPITCESSRISLDY